MASYSSIRSMETTNECFLRPPPEKVEKIPPCPRLPVPWVGPMPTTNQIYRINEDPANPLRCVPDQNKK